MILSYTLILPVWQLLITVSDDVTN